MQNFAQLGMSFPYGGFSKVTKLNGQPNTWLLKSFDAIPSF
jgi:hypothetical protein